MKESISYTFLLNIIITFVFICFVIVMGIFSYYRAFKASNIIINEIEKYEGYNCLSQASIKRKLDGISYNVPFQAKCGASEGGNCILDEDRNYAIVSYNIDYNYGDYVGADNMNTQYKCENKIDCRQTKKYQYGVYTYMYVDLPVVSGMLKLKFFAKTDILSEYRSIILANKSEQLNDTPDIPFDKNNIPDVIQKRKEFGWFTTQTFQMELSNNYAQISVNGESVKPSQDGISSRMLYQYDADNNGTLDGSDASYVLNGYQSDCGKITNFSLY